MENGVLKLHGKSLHLIKVERLQLYAERTFGHRRTNFQTPIAPFRSQIIN
jgi:hypothetical protein